MLRPVALLTLALLGAALAGPAAAQWKWRDKNGVQYSDLPPPPGVAEQDILQRPDSKQPRRAAPLAVAAASAASGPASPPPPKGVEPELEAKRKKAEAEKAAKSKADEQQLAATRAENCTRARTQLRTIEDGMRIARVNSKGEREILDDKQRDEEARHAREVVATDCK